MSDLKNVSYPKAFDKDNKIINIEEVTSTNRNKKFYCISCGKEMIPVLCTKKESHFRHKEACDCNQETYLHNLAKHYFKLKFDTKDNFPITYYVTNNCPNFDSCELKEKFGYINCTGGIIKKTYDLKEYYDTADIEKGYKGFIVTVC